MTHHRQFGHKRSTYGRLDRWDSPSRRNFCGLHVQQNRIWIKARQKLHYKYSLHATRTCKVLQNLSDMPFRKKSRPWCRTSFDLHILHNYTITMACWHKNLTAYVTQHCCNDLHFKTRYQKLWWTLGFHARETAINSMMNMIVIRVNLEWGYDMIWIINSTNTA
jgi:hypothetical protein